MTKHGKPDLDSARQSACSSQDEADVLDEFWKDLTEARAVDSSDWLECNAENRDDLAPQLEVLNLLFQARLTDQSQEVTEPFPSPSSSPDGSTQALMPEGMVLTGKLRILKHLGTGGMGEVYLAWHRTLQCEVAVKVLPIHLAENAHAITLFEDGIKAQAKIRGHENIVAVLDADTEEDRLYLVMEYVPGIDLGNLVHRYGRRGWRESCNYVRQAALALSFAHGKGVVHRDVKPSNLMLGPSGTVKLLDWGLARMASTFIEDGKKDDEPTRQGMGTHDFMSPEQAADALSVGPASDLYSLGATWYLLLVGRPPFAEQTTRRAKINAHRTQLAPSVLHERRDVPPEVDTLIRRLMAKNKDERPSSASELVGQIDAILTRKRFRHRGSHAAAIMLGVLFVLLATAAGAVSWYLGHDTDRSPQQAPAPETAPRLDSPNSVADVDTLVMRGDALAAEGEFDEAIEQYNAALSLDANCALAYCNRALAWSSKGAYAEAIADYRRAELCRTSALPFYANNNFAWILATCPNARHRDGTLAIKQAGVACEKTKWQNSNTIATLAAAYAEGGLFDEAVQWQLEAIRLAPEPAKDQLGSTLELYRNRVPLRSDYRSQVPQTQVEGRQ